MQAFPKAFQEIVRSNRRLVIPMYQRHYRWGPKQYATLMTDILDQYRQRRAYQNLSEEEQDSLVGNHYMGAVVLRDSEEGSDDWDVIDGQQRLTTVTILLAAIRDTLLPIIGAKARKYTVEEQAEVSELRKNFNNVYFITPPTKSGAKAQPRIVPQPRDQIAFNAVLNWNDPTLSLTLSGLGLHEATNVLSAYSYFKRVLRMTPERAANDRDFASYEELFADLDVELIQSIAADRLLFIEVRTSTIDDANAIFESLNFKVVPLGPVDLLKNYLFMLLRKEQDRLMNEWWKPSVRRLGGEAEFGSFILSDLVSRGAGVSRSKLYESKQAELRRISATKGSDGLWSELTRMRSGIDLYLQATQPDKYAKDVNVRGALRAIRDARGSTAVPLVMHVLSEAIREDIKPAELVRGLRLIESYLMRRFICGLDPHNLNSYFSSMLVKAHGKDAARYRALPFVDRIAAILNSSSSGLDWPADAQVSQSILTGTFYEAGESSQRMLAFKRLDNAFGQGLTILWEESALEIEHIFPRTLDKAGHWQETLNKSGVSHQEFSERYLNSLANLVPLLKSDNAKASNFAFPSKVAVYKASSVKLTSSVVPPGDPLEATWGLEQLTARAEVLSEKFVHEWPHPDIRLTEVVSESSVEEPEDEENGEEAVPLVADTLSEDALEPVSDAEDDPNASAV